MLNLSEVEHIAQLARIELTDDEAKMFQRQLSSILDYVQLLHDVDLTGIEPTSQVTGLENMYRIDEAVNCDSTTRNMIIDAFPAREGDLLKVKGVFT